MRSSSGRHFKPSPWPRRLLISAVPLLVMALIGGLTLVRNDSGAAIAAPSTPALDRSTLDAILALTSRPVEAEITPGTPVPTSAAPSTTTTAAPAPAPTAAPAGTSKGGFALPPGVKLPSDKECAKAVKKTKESRPDNKAANNTKPTGKPAITNNWGYASRGYLSRVSGNYTGSTDEIIQWASCKWGLDPEAVRAQVWVESSWRQGATAGVGNDQAACPIGLQAPCPQAFGLLQIRNDFQPNTYPWSARSTAFNLDYGLAMKRACYDGNLWIGPHTKGDAWGCVGVHYSGNWWNQDAKSYIDKVQAAERQKPWIRR